MNIDDREIRELMRKALQGRVDKNDLTGTEKANILYFARQDFANGMRMVNSLMLANANPDADPEKETTFWINRVPEIKDAQKLIEWLDPDEQRKLYITSKTDGAKQLYDEIQTYLNDWQSHTKDGLELRSRQARETISIFKRSLIDKEHLRLLSLTELDTVKYYISLFENLTGDISIRLEKFSSSNFKQPAEPAKKKTEAVTYRWIKQSEKQLPELYRKLIDGGFITSETSSETFTACFTGQPVESITKKIHWLESKVLLSYFLDSLISFEKLPKNTKTKKWSIAEKVFADAANLKQAKGNFVAYGKPDGHDRIDKILSDL